MIWRGKITTPMVKGNLKAPRVDLELQTLAEILNKEFYFVSLLRTIRNFDVDECSREI
jgi:hypothetical protein